MRYRGLIVAAALALGFAGASRADEVVHFTNGTAMVVRSHTVEKDMIRVDLGNDARMGFPVTMVEKIEVAGRKVFVNPAFGPANQAVATTGGDGPATTSGSSPETIQTGYATLPARFRQSASDRRRAMMDPEQQLELARQAAAEPPRSRGGIETTAQARALQPIGRRPTSLEPDGTYRRGDKLVLNPPGGPMGSGRGSASGLPIMSLGAKPYEPPQDEGAGEGEPPADPEPDPGADAPPER